MTRIPVDELAPIACTATPHDLAARVEQLAHLRDRLTSVDRTDEGLVLRFDHDADLERRLEELVAEEKACCAFWGFEILTSPELALRWDGPPDVQPLLDELLAGFRGERPLSALAGLL